ncbi:MAG: metal-dependent transcriptional regulator, partial [Peptostreptococcaceae bacterium]|nr:metal-dependent transcriptional regulator [Peptostreptococcaceae bacterium]MBS6063451.1 metal-dependent transcriptional regulator [Peptostreptococcaceae bacterium]
KNIFEKHTVLAQMLMSIGVDEQTATKDACKMEHVISDKSLDAIKTYLMIKPN